MTQSTDITSLLHNQPSHPELHHRQLKLNQLRRSCSVPFPNQFKPTHNATELQTQYAGVTDAVLSTLAKVVALAGRLVGIRIMGKTIFLTLQDQGSRIQLYLARERLQEQFDIALLLDLGDIVFIKGELFRTRTGELSVRCDLVQLLTKALRPLPDKFHGLNDQESRYRQRYLDLIANPSTREIFRIRSSTITALRQFLNHEAFVEVETPMMQPIPGGAQAQPFVTHHNALDQTLYLRVAPELYLKRLLVGGMNRIFEINRNFRNEGLSTRHSPEFTMLEFYAAYQDMTDFMQLVESLLQYVAQEAIGSTQLAREDSKPLSLAGPYRKLTMKAALCQFISEIDYVHVEDRGALQQYCHHAGIPYLETDSLGALQYRIFETVVEKQLIEPTFITEYPAEVSPLARRNDQNSNVADRFELFVEGRELANGFSELNDPEEQARIFKEQAQKKASGDQEAMYYDADYILALEHGMPPAAGAGIGVDRLVMLLSGAPSIREVILFPLLRSKGH